MKRDIENKLYAWKEEETRKPLLIGGVMGSGKTWCLKIFGKMAFDHVAYLDFAGVDREELAAVFAPPQEIPRIVHELSTFLLEQPISPGQTLLVLDNVQACPDAIASLPDFAQALPKLHVIAAGRSLGLALRQVDVTRLVGKVRRIELGPISFQEFVTLSGGEKYLTELSASQTGQRLSALYTRAMERFLRDYFLVGGMPEVVDAWLSSNKDYQAAEQAQDQVLSAFDAWGKETLSAQEQRRMEQILLSLPRQFSGKSYKFQYSAVARGLRAKDLDMLLRKMEDAGMIHRQEMIEDPRMPLSFSADSAYFKIFLPDVALLRRRLGISISDITQAEDFVTAFPALTENYVFTQLRALGYASWFWRSGNLAELDFLIEQSEMPLAIDLKSAVNTKSKSLRAYIERYQPDTVLRLSLGHMGISEIDGTRVIDLPLYMLWGMRLSRLGSRNSGS